jgi:HAD superfamily hydrolase (TIGR01549 family)
MIRGIIFDCFGVLCQGSLNHFLGRAKTPAIREKIVDTNHAADYGYITRDEYVTTIAELLSISLQEVDTIIAKQHIRNEPVFDLARELHPSYTLGLLSNVGSGIIERLFTPEELSDFFTAVVISGEVGMVKPYPEIFQLTAQRMGLRPDECIVIDDMLENIAGAERAGMQGVVFGSLTQTTTELRRLLQP